MSSTPNISLDRTTHELINEHAFKIVVWLGVGLCFTACCLRLGIRLACFRRLLIEDYLIILSMGVLVGTAVVFQRSLSDIYLIIHVENQLVTPGPDFPTRLRTGLGAVAPVMILSTVGVWLIKLNFLIFFYRLGHKIRIYMIIWWVATVVVIGCLAVPLSLIPYSCSLGSLEDIVVKCSTEASLDKISTDYKATISIDVISDAIIIAFPVLIVWKSGISLRQKLILTIIFLLVAFNIGVTIVRGSVFGNVYQSLPQANRRVFDTSWILFWFYMEYITSFTVASLISFRSLWVARRERPKSREPRYQPQENNGGEQQGRTSGRSSGPSGKSKWRKFHDSLLDTLTTLEGVTPDEEESSFLQIRLPSSNMNLNFDTWESSRGTATIAETEIGTINSDESPSHTETIEVEKVMK